MSMHNLRESNHPWSCACVFVSFQRASRRKQPWPTKGNKKKKKKQLRKHFDIKENHDIFIHYDKRQHQNCLEQGKARKKNQKSKKLALFGVRFVRQMFTFFSSWHASVHREVKTPMHVDGRTTITGVVGVFSTASCRPQGGDCDSPLVQGAAGFKFVT